MLLNTKMLFQILLKVLKPQLICDIGSLDGRESKRFHRVLPNARIIAFEANSENVDLINADRNIKKIGIEVVHKAVWNRNGELAFNVVKQSHSRSDRARRGLGSTRKHVDYDVEATECRVSSVRLDSFINAMENIPQAIALWVDVEGAAYEVLQGIHNIRNRVVAIHVEVETQPRWHDQRLKPEVQSLMRKMCFTELARGQREIQHDIVFLRDDIFQASRLKIRTIIFATLILTYAQKFTGRFSRLIVRLFLDRNDK